MGNICAPSPSGRGLERRGNQQVGFGFRFLGIRGDVFFILRCVGWVCLIVGAILYVRDVVEAVRKVESEEVIVEGLRCFGLFVKAWESV